ncbi:hypothetical protein [Actinopolymorpha cephalotaxi]|uniref:hypothetical protein n=1 Tax=Actinopolymorpha cephalotaxi TaxID=504797 RepID=UPI000B842350
MDREVAVRLAEREKWRGDQLAKLLGRLAAEKDAEVAIDPVSVLAGVVAVTSFPMYDALGVLADDPARAAGLVEHLVISLTG